MHYTTGRVYLVEDSQACVGACLCGEQGEESWGEEETVCRLIQNKSKVKSQFQRENVHERIS